MNSTPLTRTATILRWQHGSAPRRTRDHLAAEEPLDIQVDTRPVVVTMRTPGHDDELAAGFLVTEGLVRSKSDILKIAASARNTDGNVINVFLAPGIQVDFTQLTRHVFASSSCGLCGKASIQAVHRHFKKVQGRITVRAGTLLKLPGVLRETQSAFELTGGLHGAAIFDSLGRLIVAREDVGRHNAVDKVIGFGLLNGLLPFDRHILMVSGRASFEILQKALAARIPIIAAVSAPSSLAVQFAAKSRQTLVGFIREDRFNIYSRPERVRLS